MPTILLTHTDPARDRYYGDRSLAGLRKVGAVRLHSGDVALDDAALIAAAKGCDIVVCDRNTPVPAAVLAALPDLVAVVRVAVDIRTIDVEAASEHGVLVTHASAGFMTSVAEIVIGYMIDLSRRITDAAAAFRRGEAPGIAMGRQLQGSAIGIVGYGAIGRKLADLALALGMVVRVHDPHARDVAPGIEATDFETLLGASDFVVCLATANPSTENLFDAAAFDAMRRDAFFVNVARGMLIDEAALKTALDDGRIAGAALDVGRAPDEMPSPDLAAHPRVIATPHTGGLTPEAVAHQSDETVRQCAGIVAGRVPEGAANGEAARRLSRFRAD